MRSGTHAMDGKVALVTGAARGHGAVVARKLAEAGAEVVVADMRDELGEEVAATIGASASYEHLDVRDPASWEQVVAGVLARSGALHVLVNNAAVLRLGTIAEHPLEEFLEVINVNQVGAWLGMKTATPAISAAGGGSIVNVSSVGGIMGSATGGAYVASKFALRGLTKTAALELGPLGIRVNAVLPGSMITPMTQPIAGSGSLDDAYADLPLGRAGRDHEIAAVTCFLASDASSYCTGADFVVDGGLSCGIAGGGVSARSRRAEQAA